MTMTMTDAKEFYTTITGDDERGRQLADANAEPFDMASLGLHDKAIRSIPKPMPEDYPTPMAGETPDTFEAGEPSRTEAQVSIDQAREVAAKFVAGDTRSGHHTDVVKTREAKRALHLLGYDGDTEAELFEDIKRTAILGNAVSRELLRQDEADKRAMIGERR